MSNFDLQYTTGPDTFGSSLVGYMRTTYDDIVKVLGEPHHVSDGSDKVTAEWDIRFVDGPLVTIYDYREYKTPKDSYEWHIGGISKNALVYIAELFESSGIPVTTRSWRD